MKPQTQPASSPQLRVAPRSAPRIAPVQSRAAGPAIPNRPAEEIDFYALRQARIRQEVERPVLRLTPGETEISDAPQVDDEKFERLVEGKTAKSKVAKVRQPRPAKVPCAPCHWGLLVSTLLLTALSIPLVYSASMGALGGTPDSFMVKQAAFAAIGFSVMVLASRLSPAKVRSLSWVLYGVAVVGLALTKFSPLGQSMGNTERWIKLGPVTLQFSELAKIAIIGVMADFWSRAARDSQKSIWPWLATAGIAGVPLLLTFLQPHLSATLILFALPVAIAFFAGAPRRHFGYIFGGLAVIGMLTIVLCKTGSMPFMAQYQQKRIASHFGDGKDESRTSDYQKLQGERAIMRGGIRGVGLGASLYKNGHLPAPHTDFIYAVIGEEWGLLGTLGLIALYGAIMFFCFQTGHAAESGFDALVCGGVGTLLGLQAAGNIGVVSGLLPVTGMPLPILTYGGSGLVCALLGIGLVLAISRAQCEAE